MFQQSPKYLLLGVLAAVVMTTAPAQAQVQSAFVTSSQTVGMRYLGGDAANDVRITLSGSTFTIDDVVPVTAGVGCDPVSSDPTKARCMAPKVGTNFKGFVASPGNGNDTVVNATSTTTVAGARMQANGGLGDDVLIGDVKTDDVLLGSNGDDELRDAGGKNELSGGSGDDKLIGGSGVDELSGGTDADELFGATNADKLSGGTGDDELDGGGGDDQLDGGDGRDVIDGGPGTSSGGRHDVVIYSNRTNGVTVNLTRTDASQGTPANPSLGIPAEGDTIVDVEDIVGGSGNDSLVGNPFNNRISGGRGNDVLIGREGLDVLFGGDDNDVIAPSPAPPGEFPLGALPDGQADVIDCGDPGPLEGDAGDQAFRVVSDRDFVNDCATVVDQ